jgi:hypothetical protein
VLSPFHGRRKGAPFYQALSTRLTANSGLESLVQIIPRAWDVVWKGVDMATSMTTRLKGSVGRYLLSFADQFKATDMGLVSACFTWVLIRNRCPSRLTS